MVSIWKHNKSQTFLTPVGGHFVPFNSFRCSLNVKCNFYNIIVLFLLSPKIGRNYYKKIPTTLLHFLYQLIRSHARCYTVCYLNHEDLPPFTLEVKLLAFSVEKKDLAKIYLLPFKATRDLKLTMFQYKGSTQSIGYSAQIDSKY